MKNKSRVSMDIFWAPEQNGIHFLGFKTFKRQLPAKHTTEVVCNSKLAELKFKCSSIGQQDCRLSWVDPGMIKTYMMIKDIGNKEKKSNANPDRFCRENIQQAQETKENVECLPAILISLLVVWEKHFLWESHDDGFLGNNVEIERGNNRVVDLWWIGNSPEMSKGYMSRA